jgi:hypothetical protein
MPAHIALDLHPHDYRYPGIHRETTAPLLPLAVMRSARSIGIAQ